MADSLLREVLEQLEEQGFINQDLGQRIAAHLAAGPTVDGAALERACDVYEAHAAMSSLEHTRDIVRAYLAL